MLSLFSNEREMVILPQTKIVRFNNQWQVAKTMGKVAYVLKEKPKKLNKAEKLLKAHGILPETPMWIQDIISALYAA